MNITYPKVSPFYFLDLRVAVSLTPKVSLFQLGQYLKDAAKKAGKDAPWYSCSWPDYVKFMVMLSRSVALSVSLIP